MPELSMNAAQQGTPADVTKFALRKFGAAAEFER
jgi:hypothetical protein